MFNIFNLKNNPNVNVLSEEGPFTVIEHKKDQSVTAHEAMQAYFASQMNIRKRQLLCNLAVAPVTIQPGDMQWMIGDCQTTTGIKGIGDLFGKAVRGKMTGESAIKPEYTGTGLLVCEPTEKFILLTNPREWGGEVVLDDGLFLACDSRVRHRTVSRTNLSSALAGNEGLFNLCLEGDGMIALESNVPADEIVEVQLTNDTLKVDGNFAIAWSNTLNFTVEKSGKSLLGSAVSEEGLVNVYRGTGKVWLSPVK
ncbi:AIM24 family protein [Ileibacterium valens]|uniref:AIM24 family protein n=1 Tax=Ileibacterium valens TaxID=1862668 RepID=UPI0024B8B1F2|nr:AIM24 family protein [Ileibacterium valens]